MAIIQKLPFQEKFPEDFIKEIEVSNSEKTLDAPKALILFGTYDSENSFNDTAAHFFILNIAKTHRVAIQIIQKVNQIKTAIESFKKLDDKPIDLLVFNTHGNNEYMYLSKEEKYLVNDIKRSDFDGLSANAEILLTSCSAGNILAQKIADVTKRIVFASKGDFRFLKSSFTFCEKHGLYEMLSYDTEHQPMAFIFQEGSPPVLCDEPTPNYFSGLHEFLIKKSEQGNSYALFNLGYIEEHEGDKAKAEEWYLKAAALGNSNAQCNLGGIENKKGNKAKEKAWYLEAAKKNHLWAQYNLGVMEEQEGNKAEAMAWYLKAAEQGFSIAQFYLGYIAYREGNTDTAKAWYLKAADQGCSLSQYNLGIIAHQEGNIAQAIEWYKKSAEHGNSDAQIALNLFVKKGKINRKKRKLLVP